MFNSNVSRIELLGKDNFDTWKLQMQAILTKNDLWEYVSGSTPKPAPGDNDAKAENVRAWERNDAKARSDIILSISSSELKQIKNCASSREMWIKLEETYQSRGPARKATLLKSLTLQKMAENSDVRAHLNNFFDAVDKLNDMEIVVNPDLLSILLLYSLPPSFENFRCAIESRDELPTPEALRIKILEESDARKNGAQSSSSGAMFVKKSGGWNKSQMKKGESERAKDKEEVTIRCYKCRKVGHKANQCGKKKKESAKMVSEVTFGASTKVSEDLDRKWCLDSGASSHICNDSRYFENILETKRGTLKLASDATAVAGGEGKVHFTTEARNTKLNVTLEDTLFVPEVRTNLLSVSKITDRGYKVLFKNDCAIIRDQNEEVVLVAKRLDDLYYICEAGENARSVTAESKAKTVSLELLHRRLGHVNVRDMKDGIRGGALKGVRLTGDERELNCDICSQGKMTRTPFPKKSERRTKILELIHSDVCGPMRVQSIAGKRYFVEFIDDYSRWCEIRFLRSKSEVFNATADYITFVENQRGTNVKCLQSDNGGEYTSTEMNEYLRSRGITRRLTVPYNPEQNGTAERKNRTLLDTARCLLMDAHLPCMFWAEAVNTANFIRNRLPSKSLNGRTPFELWTGKVPDVSNFKVFGSKVHYLDRNPNRGKFDSRGLRGIFLGYAEDSKAYRVWDTERRQVIITRDVKFQKEETPTLTHDDVAPPPTSKPDMDTQSRNFVDFEFYSSPETNDDRQGVDSDDEDFLSLDGEDQEMPEISPEEVGRESNERLPTKESQSESRRNEEEAIQDSMKKGPGRPRLVRSGSRGRPRKVYNMIPRTASVVEGNEQMLLSEVPIKEALGGPDATDWRKAMAAEIISIIKNETWVIVDRPSNKRVIGCRMILRNKLKADGSLEKRKARLVAQGFSQQPGVHFTETFAPVARRSSIRLMASLAAQQGMMIRQLDVETAYLNGFLEEKVYMEPPKNIQEILREIINSKEKGPITAKAKKMLRDLSDGNKVCLLVKSLYGLRQAGRSWYHRLVDVLKSLGAKPSNSDPCLFTMGEKEESVLVTTYVDDILMASRSEKKINELIQGLATYFSIKDLGPVRYCLGIEFELNNGLVSLHQRGYIRELLSRFGMSDCNPVTTPLDPSSKLTKKDKQTDEDLKLPYRELVGALTYLSTTTRPDIAFAANYLGQFNNCFDQDHWTAAKRVLRYLKGTSGAGLTYGADPGSFKGYVDADWGNCLDDRKSYTGFLFMLNGGPISWDSRKQRTVALSTLEAEYMALSECSKEAIFLRRFLKEIGYDQFELLVFGDNRGALTLAENPTFHSRSKHIDIRHHFVRDVLKEKKFRLAHIPTEEQVADFLTKGLTTVKHRRCFNLAGMEQVNLEGKC